MFRLLMLQVVVLVLPVLALVPGLAPWLSGCVPMPLHPVCAWCLLQLALHLLNLLLPLLLVLLLLQLLQQPYALLHRLVLGVLAEGLRSAVLLRWWGNERGGSCGSCRNPCSCRRCRCGLQVVCGRHSSMCSGCGCWCSSPA